MSRLLFVVLLAFGAAGCETGFEPFVDDDRAFTLLGFLDTDADTQYVRVVPIRRVVERPTTPAIDAVVTSTDLTTGERVRWEGAFTTFADSTHGYVFSAPFRAVPGHRYRLEAVRSDGLAARAETTVPPRPGNPAAVYGALNESGGYAPLFWPGVDEVIEVDVEYRVNPHPCLAPLPPPHPPPSTAHRTHVVYPGEARGRLTPEGEWRVDLRLYDDRRIIDEQIRTSGSCLILYTLRARLAVASEGWAPPDGVWDPDVLIQPGTLSNVEGGFGFWGAVSRQTVEWSLGAIAMRDLNYIEYVDPDLATTP